MRGLGEEAGTAMSGQRLHYAAKGPFCQTTGGNSWKDSARHSGRRRARMPCTPSAATPTHPPFCPYRLSRVCQGEQSCTGWMTRPSTSTTCETAEQRTKEIGIRKVLGSSVPRISYLLTKEFLVWIIVANIIAWPIAWFTMNKWLQNYAYRIELTIFPFVLAGGLALAISLLLVSWQSVRAALANPVEALRYE